MVCGFSCEDLISMFKELKSLGVVVKELSNELRQLVREESRRLVAGCTRLPACLSVCPSVCLLASCLLVPSLRVCTCPTQPQTLNFQQLMFFFKCCTQTENKWTKEPAEVGLEIINKYKLY